MTDISRYISSIASSPTARQPRRAAAVMNVRVAMRRLSAKVVKAEMLLSEIGDELSLIIEQFRQSPWQGAGGPAGGSGGGGGKRPRRIGAEPLPGVTQVEIRRNPTDGSAEVEVKGYPAFRLTRVLADLLEALCEETGGSVDRKVGWKTILSLQKRLGQRACKRLTRTAVTSRIFRLRDALTDALGHDRLIESSRRLGYRFAKLSARCTAGDII